MKNSNAPRPRTILIVDDDPTQVLLVSQVLAEDPSFHIVTATDSHDALDKASLYEPEVIISDYYMPRMDGAEFCRRIKQHPILRERMFIMLTSASEVPEKVKVLESGADELLNKPIHPDELVSRVKACFRIMALQDELRAEKQKLVEANRSLTESNRGMLDLLTTLVGVHIPNAARRAEEGRNIVAWFAEKLSMSEEESEPVYHAVMLHEIGKINIPGELAAGRPASGPEQHPAHFPMAGYRMLSRIPELGDVAELIKHQLENYDGSGFPDRLVQANIPIGARILRGINLIEQTDREKVGQKGLVDALRKAQGTCLDPMVAQLIEEYYVIHGDTQWMDGKRTVSVLELAPGMKLAADINTGSGTKLLPKETVMSANMVDRIMAHHQIDPIIGSIFVFK